MSFLTTLASALNDGDAYMKGRRALRNQRKRAEEVRDRFIKVDNTKAGGLM